MYSLIKFSDLISAVMRVRLIYLIIFLQSIGLLFWQHYERQRLSVPIQSQSSKIMYNKYKFDFRNYACAFNIFNNIFTVHRTFILTALRTSPSVSSYSESEFQNNVK